MAKRIPPQSPFKVPKRDDIFPMMDALIAEYDNIIDTIVRTNTAESATFETVLRPWLHVDNETQAPLGMIANLQYCSPSLETQDTVRDALKRYNQAVANWSRREDYFVLLQAALEREQDDPHLGQEARFILEQKVKDYKQCGYGILSQSGIEDYLKGRLEVVDLCSEYKRNVAQESSGIWFSEKELDGVPSDELAKWKTDDSTPDQHKKFVPFANGGAQTVLRYAHEPEVRRKMYIENDKKLLHNEPILLDIMRRRRSQANKLKLPNHAAYRAPNRAVRSAEWINRFLDDLKPQLIPIVEKEVAEIQAVRLDDRIRRGLLQDGDEKSFPSWEQSYYHTMMQKTLQVDEVLISEFFPLEHVMDAMLGLFTSFLGLRFDRVSDSELNPNVKWHESVEIFAVWDGPAQDEAAGFIGYLYMDLLYREHKYRGNQNVNLECGYTKADGTRKYPSTILSCALPTPAPGTCKLLKHREVATIFHELGHAIHDLLSKTEFVMFHGSNRLPVDAGEMPSMFLENFVWLEDVLAKLSRHYTTLDAKYLEQWRKDNPGKPDPPRSIPAEFVQALSRSRYLNEAQFYCHQLTVSLFDMKLHSMASPEEAELLDARKLWYGYREELEAKSFEDVKGGGSDYTTFAHLVSGYDVGYYGYLVCEAFAQDIWHSQFAKNPWDRDTWNRYRRKFLEYGGAHPDKLKMLEDFLGRKPNVGALVESLVQGAPN
ncbi:hypothetical protein PFICI_09808 [Pestalotiopsis fici W106-1]|uniref:Peptidase M3A/M3B catalytic domain-containing protein n=1 Tax=Pestalotiopsis fici (strain W106-1 / CGMCC3.15140) TaxID=1229662 RepID=W3WXZ6_PESFW|nr:uncharacterized protein PFICI_09808 [Pestalotiopsis fici W106-1]ETS77746.1 hypothetical protein PFICI_09808 [Pestalotiopsis fici W106-1]